MSQKRLPLAPLPQRLSAAEEERRLGWCLQNAPGLLRPPTLYQSLQRGPLRREVLRQIRRTHQWLALAHEWRFQDGRLESPTLRAEIDRRGVAARECCDVSSSQNKEWLPIEAFPTTLPLLVEIPQQGVKWILTFQKFG